MQSPGIDALERAREAIDAIATSAGLEADGYDAEVLASDDVEAAMLPAVEPDETIRIGL